MQSKINPFEHNYFLGYVSQVLPQYVRVHFPTSVLLSGFTRFGQDFCGGLIGNFVIIEGDKYGFLGRLTELSLPESERLALNEKAFQTSDFHPTGKIEILLSFDLYDPFAVKKGLSAYPNIGAKVFVCSDQLVQKYLSGFGLKDKSVQSPVITLGHLVSSPSTTVSVSAQAVFGRHCAVVGTTGGGKSYTLSKLLESMTAKKNKVILIDATGEYDGFYDSVKSIQIGDGSNVFHYSQLSVEDLCVLFRPSARSQAPKLMEAIRSLKIAKLNDNQNLVHDNFTVRVEDGIVKKERAPKRPFEVFYYKKISEIENGLATFDITRLARQITEECIFNSNNAAPENYGGRNDTDISYCVSLISRIDNLVNTDEYNKIFGFKSQPSPQDLTKQIDNFLADENLFLLRFNFEAVKFSFQIREILANAIGKYLLNKARNKDFIESPLLLMLDEAHQFLNKSIGDEYFDTTPLDAFDSIAKECRKYGLFLCIATQMPRDIPHGTLSQMGTFIVHRLINYNDKEAISNACSSANRNTLEFLPVLGEGEALLTGVDFPMPIIMKFDRPQNEPNSQTPQFKGDSL